MTDVLPMVISFSAVWDNFDGCHCWCEVNFMYCMLWFWDWH